MKRYERINQKRNFQSEKGFLSHSGAEILDDDMAVMISGGQHGIGKMFHQMIWRAKNLGVAIVEASHEPLKHFPVFKVILGCCYLGKKRPVKAVNVQPRAVVDIPEVIRHFLPQHRKFVCFLPLRNSGKLLCLQRYPSRHQQERKQNVISFHSHDSICF